MDEVLYRECGYLVYGSQVGGALRIFIETFSHSVMDEHESRCVAVFPDVVVQKFCPVCEGGVPAADPDAVQI